MHRAVFRHYFPGFLQWLKEVRDPRLRPDLCTYPIEYVLMTVLMMHCGQCGSRRQLGRELVGGRFAGNIWRMVGKAYSTVACHTDTLNGVMEALDPEHTERLIAVVFDRLRRMRALDRFRFDGKLTVAIDGTKLLSFKKRHCEHCTHQTQNGITTYFHYVMVAKVVTPIGLLVPLAFEFIENPKGEYDKQDCELKAWRRLFEKIDTLFPRLQLNVTGDGLYAEKTTMADCDRRGWNFTITLTEDKLPSVTAQLPPAVSEWTGSRTKTVSVRDRNGTMKQVSRTVRWKTPVRYRGEVYHVLEMEDFNEKGERVYYNRWITNVKPHRNNAFALAQVGRLRWKIENEGINTQKNGGYEMEHAFGLKDNAWKNYYLLLQIGQLLNDLLRFGDVIAKAVGEPGATFSQVFGTIRNHAKRLIEALRYGLPNMNGPPGMERFQIRLARC